MTNNSREVEEYLKTDAFRRKEGKTKKHFRVEIQEPNRKIPIDERDRILNKVRQFLETGKGEYLNEEEEDILKEIAGVYFSAYKNAIKVLDNNKQGGIENER